jgi:hypothetical protein
VSNLREVIEREEYGVCNIYACVTLQQVDNVTSVFFHLRASIGVMDLQAEIDTYARSLINEGVRYD